MLNTRHGVGSARSFEVASGFMPPVSFYVPIVLDFFLKLAICFIFINLIFFFFFFFFPFFFFFFFCMFSFLYVIIMLSNAFHLDQLFKYQRQN